MYLLFTLRLKCAAGILELVVMLVEQFVDSDAISDAVTETHRELRASACAQKSEKDAGENRRAKNWLGSSHSETGPKSSDRKPWWLGHPSR